MTKTKLLFNYALIIIFLFPLASFAHAQQANSLTPLLTDLKGWKADPAEGMNMNMNGIKMINAVREYKRGHADVTATIMIGNSMMTQGQMQQMNIENSEASIKTKKINGFNLYTNYDKKEKTGVVLIFLDKKNSNQSLFIVSYEGLSEKQGIEFAEKFKWNKIKKATGKLL